MNFESALAIMHFKPLCYTKVKGRIGKMKDLFSVGEAAKAANTTNETLRHYDRIGLVKPSKINEWTGYRYYTKQDIVRLNTVRALQQMDLPLQRIKAVLEYDDLEKIIAFLTEAEQKADEKLAAIQYSKLKIQSAKQAYESKLQEQHRTDAIVLANLPKRVILLSDSLETPTLENLWNYLNHFYSKIPESIKTQFSFEDRAGIYTENGHSNLFAVCIRYADIDGLKTLPAGEYLCVDCTEENRKEKTDELIRQAIEKYHAEPKFVVQQIVVSGILQWKYQLQIYIGR